MGNARGDLIDDLERMVSRKAIGDRAQVLRRVTDLFLAASGKLSEEQINLFDDVMDRLLEQIEVSARAVLGHELATMLDAPPKALRRLALDDAIDVAGDILAYSERLEEATLVQGAKTKSQAHLLAISRRRTLAEPVTDVLVERGDQAVALSIARNAGAKFSEFGYKTLVKRSLDDHDLASCVWMRPEIPRRHLLKLFVDASETLKQELAHKDSHKAGFILEVVAQATQQIRAKAREKSPDYAATRARVQALHETAALGEAQLAAFASEAKFDDTIIALSLLGDLPIALVERAFFDDKSEQLILIGRALDLSWNTVKAMLRMQAWMRDSLAPDFQRLFESFARLRVETARKAVSFCRLRMQAAAAN